jgi:RHS repeat-associated protein
MTLAALLVASLVQVTAPGQAAAEGVRAGSVPVDPVKGLPDAVPADPDTAPVRDTAKPEPVVWPKPADVDVAVPLTGVTPVTGTVVSVGTLKDSSGKGKAGSARVEVLDRSAAEKEFEDGAALAVRVTPEDPAATSVGVRVDMSGFDHAYGGNYASRLQLYSVPACFAETPDEDACHPVKLASNRNLEAGVLEAAVPVHQSVTASPAVAAAPELAVTAAPAPGATAPAGAAAPDATAAPGRAALPEVSAEPSVSATGVPDGAVADVPVSPAPAVGAARASGAAFRTASLARTAAAAADPGLVGQAVVFAAAGVSGSGGDFAATPLQASASWDVGLNSGNFHYEYPIPMPPSVDGAVPSLSLGYDSQAVDGRTSASNGQVSWAGQGWDIQSGYIERRFNSCRDDGQTVDDLCWGGAPYVININGASHDLIPLPTTPALTDFRFRDDAGWQVTRVTPAAAGIRNDDNDGEYFDVRAPDGTRYLFGYGVTPWTTSAADHSAWTVTVFGDDAGEPCNGATLATSRCQQAWRWNVDRVLDPRGNAIAYEYVNEQNRYAVRGSTTVTNVYDRGGYPLYVTYGAIASGALSPSPEGSEPTSRVKFNAVDRCVDINGNPAPTCPTPAAGTAAQYPDTPVDLVCSPAATTCPSTLSSPSFFTAKRLASIEGGRRTSSAAAWSTVDTVTLDQSFKDPGSGESPELWLNGITRTGGGPGPDVTTPPVTFNAAFLDNRVDPAAGEVPLRKPRIDQVSNELGNRITLTYAHGDGGACTAAALPTPATNTKECFPRWWTPPGGASKLSWFHKYVVTKAINENLPTQAVITATPTTSSQDPQVTYYDYTGGGAWHHDDDVNAPDAKQSWSDWRGYATVIVRQRQVLRGVESTSVNRTFTRYNFFRGMHGDQAANGTAKTVNVTTTEAGAQQDTMYLRGRLAETIQYSDNVGATVGHRTFTSFAAGVKTADTVEHTGFVSRDAYRVDIADTRDRWVNKAGAIRKTKVAYTVNAPANQTALQAGVVIRTEDQGDESVTTDSRCTVTDYVWNTSAWLIRTARSRTYSGVCPATGTPAGAQLSRRDSRFDGQVFATGETPGLGAGAETGSDDYLDAATTKVSTGATYDIYGRQTSATDGNGKTSTTTYSPAIGNAATVTTASPTLGGTIGALTSTTSLEYRRQLPTQTVDENGKTTTLAYDGLGRLTGVWLPGQQPAATGPQSLRFGYFLAKNAGSKVLTETLQSGTTTANAVYAPSTTMFDGMGRTVQTQTPSPSGTGRIVDLVMYDDRGLVRDAATGVYNGDVSGSGYLNADAATLPKETRSTFDRLNRVTSQATVSNNVTQFETTTAYDGVNSTVTPPFGGQTTYLKNARDLTTGITEYLADQVTVYTNTGLAYNDRDELQQVTSPLGKITTFTNDWLGRRTNTTDPDAGASSQTYDGNGNVLTATDARNTTITTTYDVLNRPVTRSRGATVLATWAYDTVTNGKGLPASSTAKVVPPGGTTALDLTQSVTGYDDDGQALGKTWTIPASPSLTTGFGIPSAQTYTETYGYDPAGHITSMTLPSIGALPAETVTAAWTGRGRPSTLTSTAGGSMVAATTFDQAGKLTGRQWNTTTGGPKRTYGYDALDRLASITTTTGATPTTVQNDAYTYAGVNLARVTDTVSGQRECYAYDDVRRLAHAWTTNVDCTDAAAPNRTFGPGPYDQSWTFDKDNSTLSFTDKAVTGGTTATTYTGYGTAGNPAHAAVTATTTGPGAAKITQGFDASGYLTTATPATGPAQALTWNDLHQLVKSVTGAADTDFAYSAGGDRLIRKTPTETTLTLGVTEVVLPATGTPATGRRTYTLDGAPVALRVSTVTGGVAVSTKSWLGGDDQSTTELSISANNQAVTRTRYTPYGKVRATTSGLGALGTGLPTDKGFLGKTFDTTTGLSELGVRYYQAGSGVFIAPDPLVVPDSPRASSPYTYAYGNPVGLSDPSGLEPRPFLDPNWDGSQCNDNKGIECNPGGVRYTGPKSRPDLVPDFTNGKNWKPRHVTLPKPTVKPPPPVKHRGCGGFLSCMGPMAFFVGGVVCLATAPACLGAAGEFAVASADAAAGGSLGGATLVTAGAAGGARLLATRTEAQVAAETGGSLAPKLDKAFQFGGAGRGGKEVKNFVGPENAVVRGASQGRVFVTDSQGRVILDVTRDRVKPVVPGRGFVAGDGRKLTPTPEQLGWIDKLWGERP